MDQPQLKTDQAIPAKNPLPEALSWPYIALATLVALLIVLVAAAPIPVQRARYIDPNEPLTEHVDDPLTGIGVSYPADWVVTSSQPGLFAISSYKPEGDRFSDEPGTLDVFFQFAPRQVVGVPTEMNAREILLQVAPRHGLSEEAVTELTVGDQPAARMHYVENGLQQEVVIVTPNDTILIQIIAGADARTWETASILFDRMLETVTITPTTAGQ